MYATHVSAMHAVVNNVECILLFMTTFWSQLGNSRPVFQSPNSGIGEAQSWDFGT